MVLHANSDTNLHQRVFETIASCSLPLVYALDHDLADFDSYSVGIQPVLVADQHMIRFSSREEFLSKIYQAQTRDDIRASMAYRAFRYSAIGSPDGPSKVGINTYKARAAQLLEQMRYAPGRKAGY